MFTSHGLVKEGKKERKKEDPTALLIVPGHVCIIHTTPPLLLDPPF